MYHVSDIKKTEILLECERNNMVNYILASCCTVSVLKCNLVFRCFFHFHFHATCFGNSLPSMANDITSQIKERYTTTHTTAAIRRSPIWEEPIHGIILTLGNPPNLYKLLYTHFIFYILTAHRF
jgi:hypothetical protein